MIAPDLDAASKLARLSSEDAVTGCRLWTGHHYPKGYGRVWYAGRHWAAHRLAWVVHNGGVDAHDIICHRCDNRACINVAHLFIGSHIANTVDCINKGRHSKARLTDGDVAAIRAAGATDATGYRALATRYGVTPQHIRHIYAWRTRRTPHSQVEEQYAGRVALASQARGEVQP